MRKLSNPSPNLFQKTKNSIIELDGKSERSRNTLYFFVYTFAFAFVAFIVFYLYFHNGKTFIWAGKYGGDDGLVQNYNALLYYGRYLRSIAKAFLSTGKFVVPMWNFKLGLGSDILTTLHYYVIGDPLNLLSAFVKSKDTETLYSALVILRLYLSGLAFSFFCFRMKKGRFAALAGSLVYVFCGFALFASIRHPYFINPMIYLPLLLIGVEKLFARQKPAFFILTVCLCALSNFYFFYMLSILMVSYAVFRYFDIYKKAKIRTLAETFLPMAGFYIVGLMMACAIFIPVVSVFLTSGRIDTGYTVPLFYNINFYFNIIPAFTSISAYSQDWTILGYSGTAFIAIILLFCQKKKHASLKAVFVLLSLFILLPFAGHVFNGFSYVANRWVWGYSMLVAYIFVTVIPEMKLMNKKTAVIISAAAVAFLAYCLLMPNVTTNGTIAAGIVLIIAATVVVFFSKKSIKLFKGLILGVTILGIAVNSYYLYSPAGYNYVNEFVDKGKAMEAFYQSPAAAVRNLHDSSFFRYEENTNDEMSLSNSSLALGINRSSFYWSLIPGSTSKYVTEMELDNHNLSNLSGFDGRAMVGLLSSTKYFVTQSNLEQYTPFGYSFKGKWTNNTGINYSVFENRYALPLGYTYSSYITRGMYDCLSSLQKQQALLQGVLLESEQPSYSKTNLKFTDTSLSGYKVRHSDGIDYKEGNILVKKPGTELIITFEGSESSETYLKINNLWYNYMNSVDVLSAKEWMNLPAKTQKDLISTNRFKSAGKTAQIGVYCGSIRKDVFVSTPSYSWYINKHDFTTNLGYSEKAKNEIILTFNSPGLYTYDSIEIVSQPMNNFAKQAGSLRKDVLQNVNLSANTVKGTINLKSSKILCLSIPYSSGWKAAVDGQKVNILQADTIYMAIPLTAGKHSVLLTYTTPGIKRGLTVSCTGTACFIAIVLDGCIRNRVKRKRKNA